MSDSPILKGAVIGCGGISEFHLRAWRRIPAVEIVALVDEDPSRAQSRQLAFAPRAAIYENMSEALKAEGLDFVDILTPPQLHYEQCMQAAEAGMHIICQKPLCDNLASSQRLVENLAAYPKLFCVHENHPWRPWFQEVVGMSKAGFFGEITNLVIEQYDSSQPSQSFKTKGEHGVMLEYGIHLVAMMRMLLGEPHSTKAELQRINPHVEGDSLAKVNYQYEKASAFVGVGWLSHGEPSARLLIEGTRGKALYTGTLTRGDDAQLKIWKGEELVVDRALSTVDAYVEAFYRLQLDLANAMRGEGPAPQPASDNIKTLQLTFDAYCSSGHGASNGTV